MRPLIPFARERFKVIPVENDLVRPMIVENHYLHRWPANAQNCFGVVHDDSRLVGALVFGGPVRRELSKSISPLVKEQEVTELLRVWIEDGRVEDGFGQNLESFSIAQSFKILQNTTPEKTVVVSYADPAAGHTGKIYQALGGLYQVIPNTFKTFHVNLTDPNDQDGWIHSRTQQRRFGRHSIEELKFKIGKSFWIKRDCQKYRYLWFLCHKTRKQQIVESLHYPQAPYPKKTVEAPAVQEITITE